MSYGKHKVEHILQKTPSLSTDASGNTVLVGEGGNYVWAAGNRSNRIALLGDSINQNSSNIVGGTYNTLNRGIVPWMLMYLGWPWEFEPEDNYAVGGTTLDVIISNQLPALAAGGTYNRVFISAGTNDTNAGTATATIKDYFTTVFNAVRGMGAIPVVWGILPRGADAAITTAKRANQNINEWQYQQSLLGLCEFIDIGESIADNSTAFGNLIAGYAYDGLLHPNAIGAQYLGEALASYYTARGVTGSLKFATQQGDVFDRTNNPYGVAFASANPLMQGGTTAPTGMTTSGGTWSKVSRSLPNGQTRSDPSCILAATATHYLYDDWTKTGAWAATDLQPGDIIEGRCKFTLTSGVNLTKLNLEVAENNGSGGLSSYGNAVIDSTVNDGTYTLTLKTPRITVRDYAGSGNVSIYLRLNAITASGSGTLQVHGFELRKVG